MYHLKCLQNKLAVFICGNNRGKLKLSTYTKFNLHSFIIQQKTYGCPKVLFNVHFSTVYTFLHMNLITIKSNLQ